MQPLATSACKYVVSFSNLMSLSLIKRRAYLQKVSVNEFILGCISKATCIYSEGQQVRITITISGSMHDPDTDLTHFRPNNEVINVPVILRLKIELPQAIEEATKATACMKDAVFVNHLYQRQNKIVNHQWCDTFDSKKALNRIKKFDEDNIAFSLNNIAASLEHQWTFGGKKTLWAAMTTAHTTTNITLVSLEDSLKLVITSKRDRFEQSKKLLDIIERIILSDD